MITWCVLFENHIVFWLFIFFYDASRIFFSLEFPKPPGGSAKASIIPIPL